MYESYYDFSANPFQLTPDPDFYYSSKGHKRAAAYLQYGLHKGEGFIVITGEVGAGKTTLVRDMLEDLDPDAVLAAHILSTQLDPFQLLREIANEFGLDSEGLDKAALLGRMREFLSEVDATGRRAVLVVDEAQNLSVAAIEEIRMLSNFNIGDKPPLQCFLVGQPELHQTMRLPELSQFRQRTVASYHLGPLDRTDTDAYIKHRLGMVGWDDDPEFDDEALDLIYQQTDGIPRRINMLCDKILLSACLAEAELVDRALVDGVIQDSASDPVDPMHRGDADGGSSLVSNGQPQANGHAYSGQNGITVQQGQLIQNAIQAGSESGMQYTAGADNLRDIELRVSALEASNVLIVQSLRRLLTEAQAAGGRRASDVDDDSSGTTEH